MESTRKWYAMFSHTGSEIRNVSRELNRRPDRIFTNNAECDGSLNVHFGRHEALLQYMISSLEPGSVLTLHGYNRILPTWFVQWLKEHDVECYNLHPAPIQLYRELRGADPQERLYAGIKTGDYVFIGNVIHVVVPEVDAGEILAWDLREVDEAEPACRSVAALCDDLHKAATELWVQFLQEVL